MYKKLIVSIAISTIGIFANATENNIQPKPSNIDYNSLLKPLNDIQNNKALTSFISKQAPDTSSSLDTFYNTLQTNTNLLDKGNVLGKFLEEQKKNDYNLAKNAEEEKSYTIFYFISEDTSVDLIKDFSYKIEKLKEIDPTINGLLVSRGLIGGTFDTMADYVKSLQKKGVQKIDLAFHPWAYEYFKLERVPAFALSYCKKDFRFKTCEHKYLVRGEVSLTNFFEIVSDENTEYKKYYRKLIEAK